MVEVERGIRVQYCPTDTDRSVEEGGGGGVFSEIWWPGPISDQKM